MALKPFDRDAWEERAAIIEFESAFPVKKQSVWRPWLKAFN